MENKAAKTRSIDMAFKVDAELLKRLTAILSEAGDSLEYTAKFSDGSTVQYSRIEEVIDQPNSARRAISSLIAEVAGEGKSAFVILRRNAAPSVEYTVNGPQRDVLYLADKLDDWISTVSQWYSPFISKLQLIPVVIALVLPFVVASILKRYYPSKVGLQSWFPIFGLVLTSIAEYWAFKLFPRGTFATGDGLRRAQRLHLFGVSVVLAFAVSFVAGVLANWVMPH